MRRFSAVVKRCKTCGLTLVDSTTIDNCGACLQETPAVDICCVGADYAYPWSLLIKQWKYASNPALARHMAAWLQQHPQWPEIQDATQICIPIPSSDLKVCDRGFDHTLLLAQALHCTNIRTDILIRTAHTNASQAKLGRAARIRAVQHAFTVSKAGTQAVENQCVMLVDDVITTGATLRAATKALQSAGASRIFYVALARTPQVS